MADDIFDEYAQQMRDGGFVSEFREGSNEAKILTPAQAKELFEADVKIAAIKKRRKSGIFKRIRD